jgi:hypothetical protein
VNLEFTPATMTPPGLSLGAIDAAELLAYRLCDPRCLLAMESAPGDPKACTCTCGGRWHAALVLATVLPQPWTCSECGGVAEDCARAEAAGGACCPHCRHPEFVRLTAAAVVAELAAVVAEPRNGAGS